MRKQIDGLAALVRLQLRAELNEESIFLFCCRRVDRIKALYQDGIGYINASVAAVMKGLLHNRTQIKRALG